MGTQVIWNDKAGEIMSTARKNLIHMGALQTTVAGLLGIRQPYLSQMEKGARSPRLKTFIDWIRIVKPGMSPEDERFLLRCLIGGADDIDYAARLNLKTYQDAEIRVRNMLNSGHSREAWQELHALAQLAKTPLEKAKAAMLMGNRAKDLGILEVGGHFRCQAEANYNDALSLLKDDESKEAQRLQEKVMINLAELHLELQRPTAAQAYVDLLLKRKSELLAEVRAHAYFVRGRIQAETGQMESAKRNFRRGRKGYEDLGNTYLVDWISMHMAFQEKDEITLRKLINKAGPDEKGPQPDDPKDPETYSWSKYFLACLTNDPNLAEEAQVHAGRFGFLQLVQLAERFIKEHPAVAAILLMSILAMTMVLIDGGMADALAKSCN